MFLLLYEQEGITWSNRIELVLLIILSELLIYLLSVTDILV